MIVKNMLPVLPPALPIESAQYEDPVNGIVGVGCRRPWPNHIRMDHGQEEIWILRVPALGFEINHLLNFFRDHCAHIPRFFYRSTNNIHKALEDTNIRKGLITTLRECVSHLKYGRL